MQNNGQQRGDGKEHNRDGNCSGVVRKAWQRRSESGCCPIDEQWEKIMRAMLLPGKDFVICVPEGSEMQTSSCQAISMTGNFSSVNEVVGGIIWYPLRAPGSNINRYSRIGEGTMLVVVSPPPAPPTLVSLPTYVLSVAQSASIRVNVGFGSLDQNNFGVAGLLMNTAGISQVSGSGGLMGMFIVHNLSENISIRPSIQDSAISQRATAGWVSVFSDTTATVSSTVLSGIVAGTSVNDVRAVVDGNAGQYGQQCLISKDAILAEAAQSGILCVQGPDIAGQMNTVQVPPENLQNAYVYVYKPSSATPVNTLQSALTKVINVTGTTVYSQANSLWVSPCFNWVWGGVTPANSTPSAITNLVVPPGDGPVRYVIEFGVSWKNVNPVPSIPDMVVMIYPMYANVTTIAANGYAGYTASVLSDPQQRILSVNVGDEGVQTKVVSFGGPYTNAFPVRMTYRVEFFDRVKDALQNCNQWIGTFMTFGWAGTAVPSPLDIVVSVESVEVMISDYYRPGYLGPARVVSWENTSQSQSFRVQGMGIIEYQANIGLVPHVVAADVCTIPRNGEIAKMFQSPRSGLKRVYTRKEYDGIMTLVRENRWEELFQRFAPYEC